MRQRLIALGVGALFLAAVVAVAVVARGEDGELRPLPFAAGGAERSMGMAADMAFPASSVTYELADDVEDPGNEAAAYELNANSADAAERLAQALDIEGEAVKDGDAFVVADGDRQLRLERGGSWYLFDGGCGGPDSVVFDGTTSCVAKGGVVEPSAGSGVSGGSTGSGGSSEPVEPAPGETPPDAPPPTMTCDMPECPEGMACAQVCPTEEEVAPRPEPERPADLPSRADAEDQAERIFTDLGFEIEAGEVTVQDGFSAWMVAFDPEVGGVPTLGLTQNVAIGAKGRIESASGVIVEADELGDYPLAGLTRAVERLNDGSAFGGGVAVARDDAVPATGAPEPAIGVCEGGPAVDCGPVDLPVEEPGQPIDPEPMVVTLTDVRLALLHVPSFDGTAPAYLVPAYLFSSDDAGEIPVVAVTDELLADVIPAQPEPDPAGGGREPASGGGSMGSCGGAAASAPTEEDNAPLVVSVCTGATEVKVGEEVVFDVTAYDEDAPIYTGDCRRAAEAVFGDEEDIFGGCTADCAAPPEGTTTTRVKEPGKHGARYAHAYAKAGTYIATFSFESGGGPCTSNPYSSFGSASVTITVTE